MNGRKGGSETGVVEDRRRRGARCSRGSNGRGPDGKTTRGGREGSRVGKSSVERTEERM